ncbi:MAG: hypothetical protein L3K10_05580 [Thermoplasmata archaeon]|nr:hypothetical protein [Thermoplasmata archaeon]
MPGPTATFLVVGLLGFAVVCSLLGEAVRLLASRWVTSWRHLEAIERGLLDFFLGGAVVYLLAALPLGGFSLPTIVALLVAGAGGVGTTAYRRARAGSLSLDALVRPFVRPAALLSLLAGLGLLVFEVLVALPVGTGNTYDSSLLTFYTGRLLDSHQLALSFRPDGPVGILYPQGTTAWLGAAQLLLGLPGARTSLLVTPLFFALGPLGGFVLGRRLLRNDLGGLAFALVLATTASWTRVLVGGSNDFVFAFPLVLWLAGQATGWARAMPGVADAIGFGLVLGYSAALNPVGAQWLAPALVLGALVTVPRFAGSARVWLARWTTAVLVALLPLLPTWWVLGQGLSNPGSVPGVGGTTSGATGIDSAQFIGSIDPYLFRPSDVWLSPVPGLRAEIAILLTVGIALLFLFGRAALGDRGKPLRAFVLAGVGATGGLLALDWAGSAGGALGRWVELTSASEASIWLFTFFALLATLPIALALEWAVRAYRSSPTPAPVEPAPSSSVVRHRTPSRPGAATWVVPALLVTLLLVPGVVLTPSELPPVLTDLYQDFGNVSSADFDLLAYAGSHLPGGARVLVAPGSAGEFLPAYAPNARVLYPMFPGWTRANASYILVVRELTNGTLDLDGYAALRNLEVEYLVVTQANTVLWPPFSPAPLLAEPSWFSPVFHEGDAYLFAVTAHGPPMTGGP